MCIRDSVNGGDVSAEMLTKLKAKLQDKIIKQLSTAMKKENDTKIAQHNLSYESLAKTQKEQLGALKAHKEESMAMMMRM